MNANHNLPPATSPSFVHAGSSSVSTSSVSKSARAIACMMCKEVFSTREARTKHLTEDWEPCYMKLHKRLFADFEAMKQHGVNVEEVDPNAPAKIEKLNVSRDLLAYPACEALGCCKDPVKSKERHTNCRFQAVMKPIVVQFEKVTGPDGQKRVPDLTRPSKVTRPLNECMGQKPMAIVPPHVDPGHTQRSITAIRSHLVGYDPSSADQTPHARLAWFRYEKLTGQPSPLVMNRILEFENAFVDREAGESKVLVLVGDMDLHTMAWFRGTRLSTSLVRNLTILLLLKTPRTDKDYLMCVYDGPNSRLYDTTKFNYFTQRQWSDLETNPMEFLLERLFQANAKRLRKSGAIDRLWGKPCLNLNILFNLRCDRAGIVVPAAMADDFQRYFDDFRIASLPKVYLDPFVDLVLNRPFDKVWVHKYPADAPMSDLIPLLKGQLELTIAEAKLKVEEILDLGNPKELQYKKKDLSHRIQRFSDVLKSDAALNELAHKVHEHIQHYRNHRDGQSYDENEHEKTHEKSVFDLDVSHLIDDFSRERSYVWTNLHPVSGTTSDREASQPTICDLDVAKRKKASAQGPGVLLSFKDKMEMVFRDASSDESAILSVQFELQPLDDATSSGSSNPTPSGSAKPSLTLAFQPFCVLTSTTLVAAVIDSLKSPLAGQLLQQLGDDRNFPQLPALLNEYALRLRAPPGGLGRAHPQTIILIYVLTYDGRLIVSGERPRKNFQNIQRAAHSQLAQGLFVRAAGEMIFRRSEMSLRLRGITNGSGHYKPNTKTLQQVLDKFRALAGPQKFFLPLNQEVQLINSIACGIPVLSQI